MKIKQKTIAKFIINLTWMTIVGSIIMGIIMSIIG